MITASENYFPPIMAGLIVFLVFAFGPADVRAETCSSKYEKEKSADEMLRYLECIESNLDQLNKRSKEGLEKILMQVEHQQMIINSKLWGQISTLRLIELEIKRLEKEANIWPVPKFTFGKLDKVPGYKKPKGQILPDHVTEVVVGPISLEQVPYRPFDLKNLTHASLSHHFLEIYDREVVAAVFEVLSSASRYNDAFRRMYTITTGSLPIGINRDSPDLGLGIPKKGALQWEGIAKPEIIFLKAKLNRLADSIIKVRATLETYVSKLPNPLVEE